MIRPHDFGAVKTSLDLNRMNQLSDELAVEDYLGQVAKDDSV
jgi:hypothetical protein